MYHQPAKQVNARKEQRKSKSKVWFPLNQTKALPAQLAPQTTTGRQVNHQLHKAQCDPCTTGRQTSKHKRNRSRSKSDHFGLRLTTLCDTLLPPPISAAAKAIVRHLYGASRDFSPRAPPLGSSKTSKSECLLSACTKQFAKLPLQPKRNAGALLSRKLVSAMSGKPSRFNSLCKGGKDRQRKGGNDLTGRRSGPS